MSDQQPEQVVAAETPASVDASASDNKKENKKNMIQNLKKPELNTFIH